MSKKIIDLNYIQERLEIKYAINLDLQSHCLKYQSFQVYFAWNTEMKFFRCDYYSSRVQSYFGED